MGTIELPERCSPEQKANVAALAEAASRNPGDARVALELGNALYEAGARKEAIGWWEKAAKLDRENPAVWRNLGVGYCNVVYDMAAAKGAYQRAFKLSLARQENGNQETGGPGTARLLYERDQIWKMTGERPEVRLNELEAYRHLVQQRAELTIEYSALLNLMRRWEEALAILQGRQFAPEERDTLILRVWQEAWDQWARAHIALGRRALWLAPGAGGSPRKALGLFEEALQPTGNLAKAFETVGDRTEVHYWAGMAAKACGEARLAERHFARAAEDIEHQTICGCFSAESYWAGLALPELGRQGLARPYYTAMLDKAEKLRSLAAKVDIPGEYQRRMLQQEDQMKDCLPKELLAANMREPKLFAGDEAESIRQVAMLLEALARAGLKGSGDMRAARRLLEDLLLRNPSHGEAADLLLAIEWLP